MAQDLPFVREAGSRPAERSKSAQIREESQVWAKSGFRSVRGLMLAGPS